MKPADVRLRAPLPRLAAQGPETGAQFFREELRLFPSGKMTALFEFVEVNEIGVRLLRPAPWCWIEFVREDAHGNRDGDALDVEIPVAEILPVETGARKRRVRQPGVRDVVEDVVARKTLGLSVKDARDEGIAARVVIQEVARQADGRVSDSVQCLRPQPHLVPVRDPLLVDELQTLIGDLLIGGEARWHGSP